MRDEALRVFQRYQLQFDVFCRMSKTQQPHPNQQSPSIDDENTRHLLRMADVVRLSDNMKQYSGITRRPSCFVFLCDDGFADLSGFPNMRRRCWRL